MEHGDAVVPGDQHRLARRRLHEVGVVGDDGGRLAVQLLLRAIVIHPGAGVLARPRIGIEVPEADVLAGLVLHLIDLHGGGEGRNAVHLGEGEAVELAGGPEHAVAHLVELQVRLHLVHIQVVLRLAHLLGVVAIVPALDLDGARRALGMFGVGDRLHVGHFLVDAGDGGGPHLHHQVHGVLGRLGHLVLQLPGGVVGIAHQLGLLVAQRQDAGDDDLGVVVDVLVVAAIVEGAPDLFAQVPPVRIGQERVHRGAGVEDGVFALVPLVRRRAGGRVLQRRRQAGQIAVLQIEDVAGFVGQKVLAELGVEPGQLLVDRGHPRLGGGIELGALLHPVGPIDPDQLLLLRRQAQRVARFIEGVDAGEELGVLGDLVLEFGQLGRHLGLHRLHIGGGEVGGPDIVDGVGAPHRLARPLQRHDGVVEVGGAGLSAMASTSARFSRIASSSAGLNATTFTLSNGTWPP